MNEIPFERLTCSADHPTIDILLQDTDKEKQLVVLHHLLDDMHTVTHRHTLTHRCHFERIKIQEEIQPKGRFISQIGKQAADPV